MRTLILLLFTFSLAAAETPEAELTPLPKGLVGHLEVGEFKAEVPDVFFQPGAPRTRRIFLRDEKGNVTAFVDRREGLDIRWTKMKE